MEFFFMEKLQKIREQATISRFLKQEKGYQEHTIGEICQHDYDKLIGKGMKNSDAVNKIATSYHKSRSWVYERINLKK